MLLLSLSAFADLNSDYKQMTEEIHELRVDEMDTIYKKKKEFHEEAYQAKKQHLAALQSLSVVENAEDVKARKAAGKAVKDKQKAFKKEMKSKRKAHKDEIKMLKKGYKEKKKAIRRAFKKMVKDYKRNKKKMGM